MGEMKRCPFCGNEVKENYPYLSYISSLKLWSFSHNCPHTSGSVPISINIFEETREEVIERWNHRGKVKKSKGLRNP